LPVGFIPRTKLITEAYNISTLVAQNDNLQIHEEKSKGIYVKNLSDFYVSNAREVYEIMRQGGSARAVSSTSKHQPHPSLPYEKRTLILVVSKT
jgi:hypothetical protein